MKTEIGSLLFSAQYQQQPVPLEGNLVKRDWFKFCQQAPGRQYGTQIVQSWDVAMTVGDRNDFSVCTTWLISKRDLYLLDVYRARLTYPDLRRKVIALAQLHCANSVVIENAGPGLNLLQDLRSNTSRVIKANLIGLKPEGSKMERMAAQSAKIEAGYVHLLKDASWLDEFLYELLSFPNGRYDDQVDSVSQFLAWWQKHAYVNNISICAPIIVTTPRVYFGEVPWSHMSG
jgi:predicted phage terminase large subunit-like protein